MKTMIVNNIHDETLADFDVVNIIPVLQEAKYNLYKSDKVIYHPKSITYKYEYIVMYNE